MQAIFDELKFQRSQFEERAVSLQADLAVEKAAHGADKANLEMTSKQFTDLTAKETAEAKELADLKVKETAEAKELADLKAKMTPAPAPAPAATPSTSPAPLAPPYAAPAPAAPAQ